MQKIIVNDSACIGCGACVAIDPEHFAFNDEGLSHPIDQTNLDSNELKNAIETCPTKAISLGEAKDNDDEEVEEEVCEHCKHCNCEKEEI